MPVYCAVVQEWMVWRPDSDEYMIVPDTEYRAWWDSRPKMIRTRYDSDESVSPVPDDAAVKD
jgi:hypothetical protein